MRTAASERLDSPVGNGQAQFEREVTGERIRDKIASKKKGLWMGGQPSLGYDVKLIFDSWSMRARRKILI